MIKKVKYTIISESEAFGLSRLRMAKKGREQDQVFGEIKNRLGKKSMRFALKVMGKKGEDGRISRRLGKQAHAKFGLRQGKSNTGAVMTVCT